MTISVKDMNLPKFHPWFLASEKTVDELINEGIELSKTNWIVDSMFGYTLLKNEDSSAILKNSKWHNAVKLFSNQNYDGDDIFYKIKTSVLINLEGEEHGRLRRLISPYFSPASADRMRPFVSKLVNEITDKAIINQSFDIQKDLFDYVPAYTICNMLGVPKEDSDMLIDWAEKVFFNFGIIEKQDMQYIKNIVNQYIDYIDNLISKKRLNLANDLISDLIRTEQDGDTLSNDEIIMLIRVILSSGLDTGRGQLGLSFKALISNRDLWIKIGKDKDTLESEVINTFHLDGVIKQLGRFASEDIEYKGVLFPKGTIVFPSISIPNIQELDKRPLTFGRGIHYCLGASLAIVLAEETFATLSKKFPNIEFASDIIYNEIHRSRNRPVSMPVILN